MKILKCLLILAFIGLIIGGTFLYFIHKEFTKTSTLTTPVEINISKGSSLNQIAYLLEKKGIIKDARLFILYSRINKLSSNLKAGEYRFENQVSFSSIAQKITLGDVIKRTITIPEGKALSEIIDIINNEPNLKGEITIPLKEGDILPETYQFTTDTTKDDIIKNAKLAMEKALNEAMQKISPNSPIKTKEDLLILASIVEKETGLANERDVVASVFINRLKIGMRLQTDPTIIYAVTGGKMNLNRPIYKKDLAYDSPYNTYLYSGLPPTPICSPGIDAINAVATPKEPKFLYFVADGLTGGHRFATSLSEHNKNVSNYRRNLKK